MDSSHFVHVVFFWLKEGLSQAEKQAFEKGVRSLGAIRTLTWFALGTPAGTPREVVDNSYDYALVTHFADKEGHDIYQEDPIHLEFIAACKQYWTRVQVYDAWI